MKIALFAWGKEDDTSVWSGTPYKLKNILREKGVDTEHVDMSAMLAPGEIKWGKRLNKLGFCGMEKLPILFHRLGKRVAEAEENLSEGTALLFISSNTINKPLKHRAYIYVDAVIRPRLAFTQKLSFPLSAFREYGLKKYEKYDKRSYHYATKIFTQNEWSRKYIVDTYGLPAEKVVNVGFGVNLASYRGEKDFTRNLLLIVLRKGRQIEEAKGLHLLLPAFRIARQTIKDLELAVVGTEGPEEAGVTYYYNQPRSTTERLFKESVLYTMPALNEPNGITYLEALANKTPILGLERFSVPEFAGYGKYGFYTPSPTPESVAELIIKALLDKERLKAMGEAGQKFMEEKYTWSKVTDQMLQAITRY